MVLCAGQTWKIFGVMLMKTISPSKNRFQSSGALEGDVHPIGQGRSGVVYRKRFGDWDLAIKTYYLYLGHDCDEPTDEEIKNELNPEADFYRLCPAKPR